MRFLNAGDGFLGFQAHQMNGDGGQEKGDGLWPGGMYKALTSQLKTMIKGPQNRSQPSWATGILLAPLGVPIAGRLVGDAEDSVPPMSQCSCVCLLSPWPHLALSGSDVELPFQCCWS